VPQLALPSLTVLLVAAAWWLFLAGRQRFAWRPAAPAPDETTGEVTRRTVRLYGVDGVEIEGWLYEPARPRGPAVVMGPGLTGTKEGMLERFAAGFAAAGHPALAIDFRTFGGSSGTPRHWLDPVRQVEDYRAAMAFLRASRVSQRVILWGSSFSGTAAIGAADSGTAAVIAQVPFLGGQPAHPPGAWQMAGYIALTVGERLGDALARLVGLRLEPVYITTYGRPGEATFAMSADNPSRRGEGPDLHPFWRAVPDPLRGGWENRMLVRGLVTLDRFDAKAALPHLACPVFLIAARQDDMIRIEGLREAAASLQQPGSRYAELDCGHYDPYLDPRFGPNLQAQVDFMRSLEPAERMAG